jgi:hypothetical protein
MGEAKIQLKRCPLRIAQLVELGVLQLFAED